MYSPRERPLRRRTDGRKTGIPIQNSFFDTLESRVLLAHGGPPSRPPVRTPFPVLGPPEALADPIATVTVNPAQQFQTIDGLGVNLNSGVWNNGAVLPQLDTLYSTMGASLYRVIVEAVAGWEDVNDNADPAVADQTYYNDLYSTTKFTNLWNTIKFLNDRNVPVYLNVMGYLPNWLGGAGSIPTNKEDEFVEMVSTMLDYGVHTKGLTIDMISPLNEQDWGHNEGPTVGTTQYVRIINKLLTRLSALGLGSMKIVGGDTALNNTSYADALYNDANAIQHISHMAFHDYNSSNGQFANNSKYNSSTLNFWVTEFAPPIPLDDGTEIADEWGFAKGDFQAMFNHVNGGAAGAAVYDGIDGYYQHHGSTNSHGMIRYFPATNTYAIRKRMYAMAQMTRFVRPGMKRIGVSDNQTNLIQLAFRDSAAGLFAVVGQNSGSVQMTVNVNIGSIPATSLELYFTNPTKNLQKQANVVVSGGIATFSLPADTIFTLAMPDTAAPAATLIAPPSPAGGSAWADFQIKYTDMYAVDGSTLGNSDIRVTGPNGFLTTATLVGTDLAGNGTPRIATYRINAPGGYWDSLDNGSYTLNLLANQVSDTHTNFATAATLGTLTVNAQFAVVSPSGMLLINGTSGADSIAIGSGGGNISTTLGATTIDFASAGISSILVRGFENDDVITLNSTIVQPISFQGDGGTDTLNVEGGSFTYGHDPVIDSIQAITVQAGGLVVLEAAVSHLQSLTLNGGTLDLKQNALILDYSSGSPIDSIHGYLSSGYNGGAWNGIGIVSSVAALTPGLAIGYAEATDLIGAFPATFLGEQVDDSTLLLRFTIAGDANLDQRVDVIDLRMMLPNWLQSSSRWTRGDFDFDQSVGAADLSILARNWQMTMLSLSPPTILLPYEV